MIHAYHLVPRNLTGPVLYPLNELRDRLPAVYYEEIKKYTGREILLQRKIPQLLCYWNDVLHFSPVHPEKIEAALKPAGFRPSKLKWYEIDPQECNFNSSNTVIYISPMRDRNDFMTDESDFEPFSLERLSQLNEVPAATIEYFTKAKEQGERPLLFHHIPHILFRGSLSIDGLRVI
jgi:hypothetical protein